MKTTLRSLPNLALFRFVNPINSDDGVDQIWQKQSSIERGTRKTTIYVCHATKSADGRWKRGAHGSSPSKRHGRRVVNLVQERKKKLS